MILDYLRLKSTFIYYESCMCVNVHTHTATSHSLLAVASKKNNSKQMIKRGKNYFTDPQQTAYIVNDQ